MKTVRHYKQSNKSYEHLNFLNLTNFYNLPIVTMRLKTLACAFKTKFEDTSVESRVISINYLVVDVHETVYLLHFNTEHKGRCTLVFKFGCI